MPEASGHAAQHSLWGALLTSGKPGDAEAAWSLLDAMRNAEMSGRVTPEVQKA